MGGREVTARDALLADLIDYAGLFPPASLSMADAIARYARYRHEPQAWMLGRFIVSHRRLDEFNAHAPAPDAIEGGPWPLSLLASDDPVVDLRAIDELNARQAMPAFIDAIEVKAASADDVRRIADALAPLRRGAADAAGASHAAPQSRSPHLWFEVPPGATSDAALDAILPEIVAAGPRAGAKIRTGGTIPDAIPTTSSIARFLVACARHGVPWKATAGLHHPLRAPHRLTYADDSPTAMMHGFVNVFLAGVLAREGASLESIIALLDEGDAQHFIWHHEYVRWGNWSASAAAIGETRAHFAHSFGSCSFDEPVDDLTRLGWL